MRRANRDRILHASIELFNQYGTVGATTNHICRHLKISPGNLYFHFPDREAIVRELFVGMCTDVYLAWDPKAMHQPHVLLEKSFEVFWTYRFFHREMYHLRRKDPLLSQTWRRHLHKCYRILRLNYGQWLRAGIFKAIEDPRQLRLVSDSVLVAPGAFLSFFESPEKPASRRVVKAGIDHVMGLLFPYFSTEYKKHILQ